MARGIIIEGEPHHHGLHLPPRIVLPVVGTLLVTAGVGIALSRGGEPSSPVIDNAPVSDSFKPPEPPKPPELPVVAPPTPDTAPEVPKVSPLEQAIKSGRIEINNQIDTFGIVIPNTNIANILEEANRNAKTDQDFKLVLPLDLRQTPNLVLTDLEYPVPRGKTRALGMKNIPSGTTIGSMVRGEARFLPGVSGGGTLNIAFELKDENGNQSGVIARREGAKTFLPPKEWVKVEIGDPLFLLGTEEPLGFYKDGQQLVIQFSHVIPDIWNGGVANLILFEGKLIYPSITNSFTK